MIVSASIRGEGNSDREGKGGDGDTRMKLAWVSTPKPYQGVVRRVDTQFTLSYFGLRKTGY